MVDNSWKDYGVWEFCLVLSRNMDKNKRNIKLEAKFLPLQVQISMEYPLRTSLFTMFLCIMSPGESANERIGSEWYNDLHVIKAEVNLHILKMLPGDYENYILAHQVYCLAMLFDFYMDEASPFSEMRMGVSVVNVGLCRPISGKILARSFRGRDWRKMICWKDMECTLGLSLDMEAVQ